MSPLQLIELIQVLVLSFLAHLHPTTSASVPIGQNPSIVYVPNSAQNVFLIYNSAQGLESMYCDATCSYNLRQTLKCGAKLFSSSLLAIDNNKNCNKTIDKETFYCTYYMVVGYGSLTSYGDSSTTYVSFLICYDHYCDVERMEEVAIDTLFESAAGSVANIFGYSISLTTYTASDNMQYPMFTYSKYSTELKQFILNVILCTDVQCHTWIGKSEHSYASEPPYVTLGVKPNGDSSVGKGVISMEETWIGKYNYVSIMFSKNVNITNNGTISAQDVYVLALATCALSESAPLRALIPCRSRIELQSTMINNQSLRINRISMVEYDPVIHEDPYRDAPLPLFITSYVLNNKKLDELWVLYCFNLFCNSSSTLYYRVHQSKIIDYAVISYTSTTDKHGIIHRLPHIVFFENSTALMVLSCEANPNWNCTTQQESHPVQLVTSDTEFETASMQLSVTNTPYDGTSWILFSQVTNNGAGGGIFNGAGLVYCTSATCKMSSGVLSLSFLINGQQFSTSLNVTVFVIMSWIVTFITIFGIVLIYKCLSPMHFMRKNVRNAYLNQVALESARIRPLFYWFFLANLICSAMCDVPWFAYFDVSDLTFYSPVIIGPFVPVILSSLMLITLHVCPLTVPTTYFLLVIAFMYWLSTILLSYSFGFVWNLTSENCQISDLSGLKIVILTGHIATCLVVEYLLFWNIRCFQSLRLASPERLRDESMYFAARTAIVNDMNDLMSYRVAKGNKTLNIAQK